MIKNKNKRQIISGATIFNGNEFLDDHLLVVCDEKITEIIHKNNYNKIAEDAEHIEFNGGILTAGFIDIQVNGGGGILLNDEPSVAGMKAIIAAHRKFGTTAMLPTLISDSSEKMQVAVNAANQALEQGISGMVGLHLEGPYFNIARKGVHLPAMIRDVDNGVAELYKTLKNGVLMVTLAPEKVPAGFIKDLTDAGILVYCGHSDGTYEQIQAALGEGLCGFTHLFNAMSPMLNREPGVVGAALEDEETFVGIILDNQHVAKATAKVAINAKKRGKMCIITDAMPPVGAVSPHFELYGEAIQVKDSYCITDAGTLAGSALDMATAVRNCHKILGFELGETLRMASLYPANALRLGHKIGQLKTGLQADIVHLDDDLFVTRTAVKGDWN
ncbi:MAG: N-acetylglucosamine-6-phosphate deacetylase [Alphaproteobacteria bacterium]|nr:N-acetylglucosamine-6-phosphate deacetylase [Alphaproteobacteria bacterium]